MRGDAGAPCDLVRSLDLDRVTLAVPEGERVHEIALRLADRGYVMESGRTILGGTSAELLQSIEVKRIFLGDTAL